MTALFSSFSLFFHAENKGHGRHWRSALFPADAAIIPGAIQAEAIAQRAEEGTILFGDGRVIQALQKAFAFIAFDVEEPRFFVQAFERLDPR